MDLVDVELLASGVSPGAGRYAEVAGGDVEPAARRDGSARCIEGSTALVGEMNTLEIIGVALYPELPEMV